MKRRVHFQSGFAAIAAIIVLTVLAGMGAYMVSFSNTQQLGSAQDMQGTRAYWAARAGLEWALGAVTANSTVCPTSPPATVDTGNVFNLNVNCSMQTYPENGVTVTIFSFQSIASSGAVGSIGYVERSVSAAYEVPR
jgi:MSHA biogenesis protein MshP